jgi:WD40 repeat protein
MYDICKYHVKDGNCSRGDGCKYMHGLIEICFQIKGHDQPVKSLGLVQAGDTPRLLSGSADGSIKVWNLALPNDPEFTIPARGPVQSIEVSGSNIMWSNDESLDGDRPGVG